MSKKEVILFLVFGLITLVVIRFQKEDNVLLIDTSYDVSQKEANEEVILTAEEIIQGLQNEYNNKDIKALLRIKGTNFKTPIPQSTDNNYYYRRLPDKSYSIIGSTYLDYRTKLSKSRVLIIYGHNSSKYNMPFKILENYYNKDYYDHHKYIELVTVSGIKTYEVFSVYVETNDFAYYADVEFKNDSEFFKHITSLKEKSFYDTGVSLNKDDNILILQACSTHKKYQKYKHKFVLIIAREVRNEKNS